MIALSGCLGPGYEKIYEHGITSVMTTVNGPMSLEEAMSRVRELYYQGAIRMFRMIKVFGLVLKDNDPVIYSGRYHKPWKDAGKDWRFL